MEANRPDEPGYAGINTFQKAPLVLNPVELAGADVAILGAPMDDMVTHRPGTRFGPREIRSALEGGGRPRAYNIDLGVDPFEHLKVVDHGDASVTPGSGEANHRAIKKAVAGIVNAGAIPIVLGGDHSISYPNISAVAEVLPKGSLAVVHFDTHADTALENWDVNGRTERLSATSSMTASFPANDSSRSACAAIGRTPMSGTGCGMSGFAGIAWNRSSRTESTQS